MSLLTPQQSRTKRILLARIFTSLDSFGSIRKGGLLETIEVYQIFECIPDLSHEQDSQNAHKRTATLIIELLGKRTGRCS